jgi:hypothetical protein
MPGIEELSARHGEIIDEMGSIRAMRKGSLNATWRDVTHKDGEVARKGPYWVLTNKGKDGKTQTVSVAATDVARVRGDVENYRRFRELADECIEVCEEMALGTGTEAVGAKKN